jgi:hypothetical protein
VIWLLLGNDCLPLMILGKTKKYMRCSLGVKKFMAALQGASIMLPKVSASRPVIWRDYWAVSHLQYWQQFPQ